jgi:hypothetical protein
LCFGLYGSVFVSSLFASCHAYTRASLVSQDDGVTRAGIETAAYTRTTIVATVTSGHHTKGGNITIGPAVGKGYTGQPTARSYTLNIHGIKAPTAIEVDGVVIQPVKSLYSLESVTAGWWFNKGIQGGVLMVKVGSCPLLTGCTVSLVDGTNYPRVCLDQCDTVLHHQVISQVFNFPSNPGSIVYNSTGECLTASNDPDGGSGTPALEIQPCKAKDSSQQWAYSKETEQLSLANSPKKCADQDVSDNRVEMYGCGNGQSNQKWTVNADNKGHIRQAALNQLCMTPCPDSVDREASVAMWIARRQQSLKNQRAAMVSKP